MYILNYTILLTFNRNLMTIVNMIILISIVIAVLVLILNQHLIRVIHQYFPYL